MRATPSFLLAFISVLLVTACATVSPIATDMHAKAIKKTKEDD